MLFYFHGQDTYAARQEIAQIVGEHDASLVWVDVVHIRERALSDVFNASATLFGKQLFVLRDPRALSAAHQASVAAFLKDAPADLLCILWDRGTGKPLTKFSRLPNVVTRPFPILPTAELVSWLLAEAQERGGVVEKPAAHELLVRVGTDRWQLLQVLDRLLLRESTITKALVEREVESGTTEEAVFALLDDVARGKQAAVFERIDRFLVDGHSEFYLFSMLAFQFRTLLLIAESAQKYTSADEIARDAGVHPFVVKKNMPLVKGTSFAWLRSALTRVGATEFAVRQGRVDARTGLLMLLLYVTQPHQSAKVGA